MTIDEAIKFCHEKSENIKLKAEPQVFIDIANMLEELKVYKECNIYKTNFSMGYNNGIDDFLREIKIDVIATTFGLRICDAERIAQQLKAGGID